MEIYKRNLLQKHRHLMLDKAVTQTDYKQSDRSIREDNWFEHSRSKVPIES